MSTRSQREGHRSNKKSVRPIKPDRLPQGSTPTPPSTSQVREADENRIEQKAAHVQTGPMQFGDDCPGYYLRADDAYSHAQMLHEAAAWLHAEAAADFKTQLIAFHLTAFADQIITDIRGGK